MAEEEKKPAEQAPAATTPPATPSAQGESLDGASTTDTSTGVASASSGVGEPQQSPEGSTIKSVFNVYFILFIVVVLAAISIIYYAVSTATKSAKTPTKKTQTLTSDQIAQLKGSTTLVGDNKSTLEIQSNAVFDGQALVKNDFSVSGGLKVGGTLSLKDLSVGGTATFSDINVSGNSNLNGNTSIQGGLSIQKGLNVSGSGSFGSLNVGQLTVTSIQLGGDLNLVRHVTTGGGSVSRTAGTALGSAGTVSVSGNDISGTVSIHVGNTPPAGIFATVKFSTPYSSTPRVIITPIGSAAALVKYYVNRDNSGFSIGCSSPPPAGSSFAYDYIIVQ